jgi:hypothetical protein
MAMARIDGIGPRTPLAVALARCRVPLVLVGVFSGVVNLLQLTTSLYMMQVFDRVLTTRSLDTLAYLSLIALFAVLVLALLEAVRGQVMQRIGAWVEHRVAPAGFVRAIEGTLRGQHELRRAVPALARPPEAAAEGRARPASPLALYLSQPDLAAAASKALLYLTVLSVASLLMTGYLCWAGVPKAEVALFRGAGAATGLLATVAVPLLSRRLPLLVVGRISIAYQLAWLAVGVLPLALSPSPPSLASLRWLMAAVVLSRTGLWAFDIAATQIMQLGVTPSSALGTVSGVQGSSYTFTL